SGSWPTHEDGAPARRVLGGLSRIRSGDRDDVDGGIPEIQLIGRARESALRRLETPLSLPVTPDERYAHLMRAGTHGHADRKAVVGRVHVDFPFRIALRVAGEAFRRRPSSALAADREPLDQCTIQADVDLVRLAHTD